MRVIIFAIAVVLAAGPVAASDKSDVMAEVHKFVDDFNKGDMKAVVAECADQAAIVDEFAPYAWQGASACSDWANADDAYNKKNGITNGVVTLGKVRHIEVTDDRAYVVATASFTYKQNGKKAAETGSSWAAALQKTAAGWRITGSGWAQH
jgi:ketosteroid isomerase-like protein